MQLCIPLEMEWFAVSFVNTWTKNAMKWIQNRINIQECIICDGSKTSRLRSR